VAYAATSLVEVERGRAVVTQPAAAFLDNHVGVRHASALYTAAYEAARALVLGAEGTSAPRLVEARMDYRNVGFGSITAIAEPAGDGWLAGATTVDVAVTASDDAGKTVFSASLRWTLDGEPER